MLFVVLISLAVLGSTAANVNTNTPVIQWKTRLDISGVWAFRVTVSSTAGCSDDTSTLTFDTGVVWQENEPFNGSYTYAGPPLQPSMTYFWCCWETQLLSVSGEVFIKRSLTDSGQLINRTWFAGNGSFTMSATLPSAIEELREVLGSANISELYRGTVASIVGRVAASGWMPTSVSTQTYSGMFVRDSAAGVFAMLELGEIDVANRVLTFMLSNMVAAGLRRVPHVILGPPEHVSFDMVDQPDGSFHLVIAWAHFVGLTGDTAMRDAYYDFMSTVVDGYVAPGAVYPNSTVPYFDSTLNVRRPMFLLRR